MEIIEILRDAEIYQNVLAVNFKDTDIFFCISKRSKRYLAKVFQDYTPEELDYRFDQPRVQVKLFQKQYI